MTIEYKDSKRIVALSYDNALNTATFEDDFSGTDNWTDDGDDVVVNTGTDVLDWASIADGNDDLCYKDLTSVSDSKWVAEFDITFDNLTSSSSNGSYLAIYLDSVTTAINTAGHDGLGIVYELDNSITNKASIGAFAIDNKNPYDGMKFNSGTGARSVFTETAQASETQYVRMIRDGATFTVEIYSDITRQTLVESESVDANNGGTVSGLRYFKIATGRDNTNSQTFDGTIDNVKFYNNVSSVNKPNSVQDNSLLVEKDTGNRYWFDAESDITPTDLNTPTWTKSTSDLSQTTDYLQWANMTGGTENGYYDIGSGSVSDTKWVLRAKLTVSSYSTGTAAHSRWCSLGLSSTSSTMTGTQDSINIILRTNTSSDTIAGTRSNGTGLDAQLGTAGISGVTLGNGTFYLEMIRESDSDYKLYVRSGSHTGTLLGTGSYTDASGVTGLQYIKTGRLYSSVANGNFVAKWEDIEFYNNTTSTITPATWKEDMTGVTGALTVDNFTVGTNTQASSTGTESHTVSASSKQKKILLVTVRTAGLDSTQSACTYAGVAMTSLGTAICGTGNYTRQTCFYLLDPPTGTADIVVTKSNSGAHCKIIALSLYGAKQSAPTFAINSGNFSPTAGITTNITPPANSWVYSSLSGSDPINSSTNPPSTYYTNAELTVLNSDTSVTKKKYGLKKDPTTGSTNAVKMYFKHSANNNNQPVVLSAFAVEAYG